jgi:hypothetical protein
MAFRPYDSVAFDRLQIAACFADPHFGNQLPSGFHPSGVGAFSQAYSLHGLFIKIHKDYAYRNGRNGLDETVVRYPPMGRVIYSSCADFRSCKPSQQLEFRVLGKALELDPAGVLPRQLLAAMPKFHVQPATFDKAIASLCQAKLIRIDGPLLKMTGDGVRSALKEGYSYSPSLVACYR